MRVPTVLTVGLAFLLLWVSPAPASLIYFGNINLQGTGHGNVTEILGFQGPPSGVTTQSGCVKYTLTGVDGFGGDCPDSANNFGNDQISSGGNTSQTVRVGDVLATMTPFSLALTFDPSEHDAIQVDSMVLTFYNPNNPGGELTFTSHSLTTPVLFPDGGAGSGGSGFVFGLDWEEAVAVSQWVIQQGIEFQDVRLGLGAELSQVDSHSYFYVMNINDLVQAPEPATLALIGGGLLALGLLGRRKKA